MMDTLHPYSSFYDNYEAREEAFRRLVDFKLARRHAGPALFWQDFSRISRHAFAVPGNGFVAYITSNPRDCLAFGTPRQVLSAALMTAGTEATDNRILQAASRFGIAGQLTQPIRTLSGGETVKLALAKADVGMVSCSRLVVSSPFTWLSAGNRHLLDAMVAQCRRMGKKLSLLALNGEDHLSPIGTKDPFLSPGPEALPFFLKLSGVRIPLTLSLNPLTAGASHAAIDDACLQLESPCVVTGDNGQGKSLVARALAGALSIRGNAVITGPQGKGTVSLLFQDVLTQTLLRSFSTLAEGGPGVNPPAVLAAYARIRDHYAAAFKGKGCSGGDRIGEPKNSRHTLLDIKAMLVAARLAAAPGALILDEPDWGLGRPSAIAFVSAVLSTAHRQGTPVILISHKPWWRPVARSTILVSRTAAVMPTPTDESVFSITLHTDAVGQ